jgi:hypothetical protein
MKPIRFEISETDEILVSHSGLAIAGAALGHTQLKKQFNQVRVPGKPRPEISHYDCILAMTALLCLAKTDFDDRETYRQDDFFSRSLGVKAVASAETLRQRLNDLATIEECSGMVRRENAYRVNQHAPVITSCYTEWVPLDIDVSPFDNSGTQKEGVSCTYKKIDGYAPIFAYVGLEGYMVNGELRQGSQHSQEGTPAFLTETIALAKRITKKKLLLRTDAAHDAIENLKICSTEKVDYIIKRNLRKESIEQWLLDAQRYGTATEPRNGKEVFIGETWRERDGTSYRVVFKVTRRTQTADGQLLLMPELEVDTYWTSLKLAAAEVIKLYQQHGTSEQFHSEVKTGLDLERLPSGKFATNALVLLLGMLAYNMLRIIGQSSLLENRQLPPGRRAPVKDTIKRRRLRSVIQDLMYMACRLTRHARRWGLTFWRGQRWMPVWQNVYERIRCASVPAG